MNAIVLIGFMGVGKSTIGEALARRLSYDFLDSDTIIEDRTGINIPDIFKSHGEEYFRGLEYEVIRDIVGRSRVVISTGGGAIMNERLFGLLLSRALVIHLEATKETLYSRLEEPSSRPMLHHGNLRERIDELYELRHPTYMRAHYSIKIDGKDVEEIVGEILELVKRGDPL